MRLPVGRRLFSGNGNSSKNGIKVKLDQGAHLVNSPASANGSRRFKFNHEFKVHRLANPPALETLATREELLDYHHHMVMIRRMELAADALYKSKMIRGFCHLAIGQEAIPVGIEAALEGEDKIITAYRCHGFTYTRGATVRAILAELLGKETGVSRGKGGSMHMYAPNFYGGNGIVGAQVPLGAGLAWAQKYRGESACTFALYGDGAANQGQVFEAYNLAALHQLPVVFACENNLYSMGTSLARSSASTALFTRGDYIPGIQVNGMDVLAVREAARHARQHALSKGPILLEFVTYRYQGHSMSDPGTSYRTRDEVQEVRSTRDPLSLLQSQIQEAGWATEDELSAIEKEIRAEVDEAVELAKADAFPADSELFTDIYLPETYPFAHRGCEPASNNSNI